MINSRRRAILKRLAQIVFYGRQLKLAASSGLPRRVLFHPIDGCREEIEPIECGTAAGTMSHAGRKKQAAPLLHLRLHATDCDEFEVQGRLLILHERTIETEDEICDFCREQ